MADAVKRKVLIADDDPDIVEALKTVLEAKGFAVATAPNGQEALRKLRADKPDVIILDVMMTTETEGFHVAYEMRADEALRDIPVLMLTAIEGKTGFRFSPDEDEDYLPVEEFVTKPVDPADLVKRVTALIDRKQAKA